MRNQLTLALLGVLLAALVGCEAEMTSISSGPFNVDGNTGRATGEALGIHFEVAGATGVRTESQLKAGKPEHTSARTEITLADDAIIRLEMLDGGSPISFQLNGTDFGTLEEGDRVVIDEDRNVTINGNSRGPLKTPARPTAQHVARFTHGPPMQVTAESRPHVSKVSHFVDLTRPPSRHQR